MSMKLSNEVKIGILVIVCVAALLTLSVKVGKFNFAKKGYTVTLHFYRIEGLDKNAPVKLNGLEVGSVKGIKILYEPETIMEMTIWLDESAKLHEGAEARVKVMGLLGEKFIELTGGTPGMPFLGEGALIIGKEPLDFENLLAKGDEIADSLKKISANLSERLEINSKAIDEIISNINSATKDIAAISSNVNERLAINKKSIDEIVANLHGTTENLNELSSDLKANPWKLMYKSKEKQKRKNSQFHNLP